MDRAAIADKLNGGVGGVFDKFFAKELAGAEKVGIVSAYQSPSKTFGINEKLTSVANVAYLSAPLMGKN
jgi:hypothetical protein